LRKTVLLGQLVLGQLAAKMRQPSSRPAPGPNQAFGAGIRCCCVSALLGASYGKSGRRQL